MVKDKDSKLIIGMLLLIVMVVIVILAGDTYAFEGYGEVVLECDKEVAVSGDDITCSVKGRVADSDYVSCLSLLINLSDNLEFVSFTSDDIWQGTGDNGNVQLYSEEDYAGEFKIGTFQIKVKDDVINTKENILLSDIYFYTEEYEEEVISDVSLDISSPDISSLVYDLDKDYIVVDTKDIEDIIGNVKSEVGTLVVVNNDKEVTTGEVSDGAKLRLKYNDSVIREYDILYVGTDKYYLIDSYVVTNSSDISMVSNDIDVINGVANVKNDKLVISYNGTDVLEYTIVNVNSSDYIINVNTGIIVIDVEVSDSILDNISTSDGVSLNINGNSLDISYDNEVIRSLKIASLVSDIYEVKLDKGYIYVGEYTSDKDIVDGVSSKIDGVEVGVESYQLVISSLGDELVRIDIVSVDSDKYKIDYDANYVYTGSVIDMEEIKSNVEVTKASISSSDNKLVLKYGEDIVKEFNVYNVSSDKYQIKDKDIYVTEEVSYSDFISQIDFNGVSYKLYDKGGNEVTSGNVSNGYGLKIYYEDTLLDSYNVVVEYLEFSDSLSIDEDSMIIYKVKASTTYSELVKNIDTNGEVSVKDSSGNEVALDSNVKSNDVILIVFSSSTVEYKVSVFGDVMADGKINIGDVAKLYRGIKGKVTLSEVEKLSSEVMIDGKLNVGDVAKLYRYLKGKISSLG